MPRPSLVPPARGAAMVLAAGVLFSTGGAAVKLCSFEALQVAWLRAALAVPVLLVLLRDSRRLRGIGPWLVGSGYAATLTLFVIANKHTTAANTIFLQASAPLWVLLLAPLLLGERAGRGDLAALLALAAGMALVFAGADRPTPLAPDPVLGNLAATAAGLCYGLTLIGFRHLSRQEGGATAAAVAGNALTAAVCLGLAASAGQAWPEGNAAGWATDWLAVAWLGLFQVGLAYVLLTKAMAVVPALHASLLLLAEPALNPLWAFVLLGERPSAMALLGGGVILATVLARAVRGRAPAAK